MRYRVIYHLGEAIDVRTPVESGMLVWGNDRFQIEGAQPAVEVPFSSVQEVELFRMHGLGRMIRVEFAGQRLFVTVVRFKLGNFFALVNFFKTGELSARLQAATTK